MFYKRSSLTPQALRVIRDKGTQRPFSVSDERPSKDGTYLCRQCGLALFRSQDKFDSGCGWPSFDASLADHVKRIADMDGIRTEIVCNRCEAHLGHLFEGEGFTAENTRHCVNRISLDFIPHLDVKDTEEGIFCGGCFWGVETLFQAKEGVLLTQCGYIGGTLSEPSYEHVCSKQTGHLEAVRVIYDPERLSYDALVRYFFEIHDPSQSDGQGPDIGPQYLSAIFYYDADQKARASGAMDDLHALGLSVSTTLREMQTFWPAESYHQNYYQKTGKRPYCHVHRPRFGLS